jgi:hypothetical protein
VKISVEVGFIAVFGLSYVVGQQTQQREVCFFKQGNGIFIINSDAL